MSHIGSVSHTYRQTEELVGIVAGQVLEVLGEKRTVRESHDASVSRLDLSALVRYVVHFSPNSVTLDVIPHAKTARHQLHAVEEVVQDVLHRETETGGEACCDHGQGLRRNIQKRDRHDEVSAPGKDSDHIVGQSQVQLVLTDHRSTGLPEGLAQLVNPVKSPRHITDVFEDIE